MHLVKGNEERPVIAESNDKNKHASLVEKDVCAKMMESRNISTTVSKKENKEDNEKQIDGLDTTALTSRQPHKKNNVAAEDTTDAKLDVSDSLKMKMKDCKWEKQGKGMCRRGGKCYFNHDESTMVKWPTKDGRTPCTKEFRKEQSCHRGSKCHFSHEITNEIRKDKTVINMVCSIEKEIMEKKAKGGNNEKKGNFFQNKANDKSITSNEVYDYPKTKNVCAIEFRKEGGCERGSKCRYSHKISNEMRRDKEMIEMVHKIEEKMEKKTENENEALLSMNEKKNQNEQQSENLKSFFGEMINIEKGKQRKQNDEEDTTNSFLYLIRCLIQGQIREQVHEQIKGVMEVMNQK